LVDDRGQRVARYDKLHLFDADVADSRGRYRESDHYAPGQRLVVADTPLGRLGMTVCYDLRFAELYLALRAAGAELISVPSAFTLTTGAAHWQSLIRARAIETQCYMLAAAQGGEHPGGRITFGHSSIVDCWGRMLCEQPTGDAVLSASRDAAEQAAIRQCMPALSQRRVSMRRRWILRIRCPSPGYWKTASSRQVASTSSRAWACAPCPARRPASPTAMRSLPMRCVRARRRHVRSPAADSRGGSRC